jgi:hypothetical protein
MTPVGATAYEITVAGHLDDHWSERLAGMQVVHRVDGTTILTGLLADQAQLHGVICGLRDIGAVLLGLRVAGGDAGRLCTASETQPCCDPSGESGTAFSDPRTSGSGASPRTSARAAVSDATR